MNNSYPIRHPEYRGDNAPLGSYPELVTALLMDLARAGTYAEAQAVTTPLDDIAKQQLWKACPKPLQQRLKQMKADALEPRRVYRLRKGGDGDASTTEGMPFQYWFSTSEKDPQGYAFDIRSLGFDGQYQGNLATYYMEQSNFLQQAIAADDSILRWPPTAECEHSITFVGVA
jgi:hypothetical protein